MHFQMMRRTASDELVYLKMAAGAAIVALLAVAALCGFANVAHAQDRDPLGIAPAVGISPEPLGVSSEPIPIGGMPEPSGLAPEPPRVNMGQGPVSEMRPVRCPDRHRGLFPRVMIDTIDKIDMVEPFGLVEVSYISPDGWVNGIITHYDPTCPESLPYSEAVRFLTDDGDMELADKFFANFPREPRGLNLLNEKMFSVVGAKTNAVNGFANMINPWHNAAAKPPTGDELVTIRANFMTHVVWSDMAMQIANGQAPDYTGYFHGWQDVIREACARAFNKAGRLKPGVLNAFNDFFLEYAQRHGFSYYWLEEADPKNAVFKGYTAHTLWLYEDKSGGWGTEVTRYPVVFRADDTTPMLFLKEFGRK